MNYSSDSLAFGKLADLDLDLSEVVESNGRIRADFVEVSPSFAVSAVVTHWGLLFGLLLALPVLWSGGLQAIALLLVPFLGLAAYRLTILMHECAHNTLFKERRTNNLVGRLTGWMIGSDFEAFRRLHWQHHRRYGEADDPQGRDYLGLIAASRGKILWHLARPLFGFNLFKLGGFIPKPGAAEGTAPTAGKRLKFLSGVLAVQALFAAVATGAGAYPLLALCYPLGAATFGLFFSQTRGFCEHVPPAAGRSERFVRTHTPNWLDRVFFYSLNFNYHIEHHLFPAVSACQLPALHRELRAQLQGSSALSASILSTIEMRLDQCKK